MKVWALYLPAFHRIKENDEWWGEGFTEWDNVRNAKPLYKKHVQPQIPLDNNYYDLSQKDSISKQVELANEYGIDGFICYHYWFNGKKLLEKPCEIILENKDINMKFAFCWANEPWARTWDGKDHEVLMPQEYGNREDWKKHIEYLIEFFKDERYIKIDNKPVLFVYSPSQIPNFDEMIEYWNYILKEHKLEEIYLIEYISTKNKEACSKYSSGIVEFEPLYTTFFDISKINKLKRFICKRLKRIDFQKYDKLWKYILKRKRTYNGKTIYKGCFVAWDNSPRKSKASMIVKGQSPEKFEKYLKELVNYDRKDAANDYVIVNAWNEWGEGAMLEPTERYGHKYLEAIKNVKNSKIEN